MSLIPSEYSFCLIFFIRSYLCIVTKKKPQPGPACDASIDRILSRNWHEFRWYRYGRWRPCYRKWYGSGINSGKYLASFNSLFGVGLLMALVPVAQQLNKSGRQVKIPFEIQQGAFLALVLSIPIIGVLFQTQAILQLMDIGNPNGRKDHRLYECGNVCSASLLFQTLRSFNWRCMSLDLASQWSLALLACY